MKILLLVVTLLFTFDGSANFINFNSESISNADSSPFSDSGADISLIGSSINGDSLVALPTPVFDPNLIGPLFSSFDFGGSLFSFDNVMIENKEMENGQILRILYSIE